MEVNEKILEILERSENPLRRRNCKEIRIRKKDVDKVIKVLKSEGKKFFS